LTDTAVYEKMISAQLMIEADGRISVNLQEINNARVIIVSPSNRVLLVGGESSDSLVYNIPGGKVSPYDRSPLGTAHRELFEETYDHAKRYSYPITGDLCLVDRYIIKHAKMNIIIFCYRMDKEPTHLRADINNPEVSVYEWIPFAELASSINRHNRAIGPSKRMSLMGKKSVTRFIRDFGKIDRVGGG
jgi:ADP-ribose pyrophosphatase YjhB (NUDIX family)